MDSRKLAAKKIVEAGIINWKIFNDVRVNNLCNETMVNITVQVIWSV